MKQLANELILWDLVFQGFTADISANQIADLNHFLTKFNIPYIDL